MRFASMVGCIVLAFTAQVHALEFDSDVSSAVQQQFINDLEFISQVQGEAQTQLHRQIFGGLNGQMYSQFFTSRVRSVGMSSCGSANAVACVMPFWDSSKMWLTENFVKFSHPQIARLMILFHEARHTERQSRFWNHASCPVPFLDENGNEKRSIWTGAPLAGEAACDVTPMGSYGSSTIMLKNVSKYCANCQEKVRMDADLYATDQLGRISSETAKQQMISDFNGPASEPI